MSKSDWNIKDPKDQKGHSVRIEHKTWIKLREIQMKVISNGKYITMMDLVSGVLETVDFKGIEKEIVESMEE